MSALWSTLVIIVSLARLVSSPPQPKAAVATQTGACAPVCLSSEESLVVQIVNDERRAQGLATLDLDPVLVEVARRHSLDMATRRYFDHIAPAPAPATPLDRYAAALGQEPRCVVGENIGCAPQPLMGVIHNQMMDSPLHRANITDVEYVRMGVGIYETPDGRVWVTEMFCGATPGNAPTSGS